MGEKQNQSFQLSFNPCLKLISKALGSLPTVTKPDGKAAASS